MCCRSAGMDCDVVWRTMRSGRSVTQLVILPDADISEPETDSDASSQGGSDAANTNVESFDSDDEVTLYRVQKKKPVKSKAGSQTRARTIPLLTPILRYYDLPIPTTDTADTSRE